MSARIYPACPVLIQDDRVFFTVLPHLSGIQIAKIHLILLQEIWMAGHTMI